MRVLSVEDWAEIRRLSRAERMPIKVDSKGVAVFEEHGEGGVRDQMARRRIDANGPGRWWMTVEPRIRELLQACSKDAGHGDHRSS